MPVYVQQGPTRYMSVKQLDDGTWYAWIEDTPGVWGTGPTNEAACDECIEVLKEWEAL